MVGPNTNIRLNELASGVRTDLLNIAEKCDKRLLDHDDPKKTREFIRDLSSYASYLMTQLAQYVNAVRDAREDVK